MKSITRTFLSLSFVILFSLNTFAQDEEKTKVLLVPEADSAQLVSYSLDVLGVIDAKCLGCHSPSGRNEKSRKALQWEKLQAMEAVDAYATLDEIMEVLDEGSMPPEKIVEKYPNMKLTEEETATLRTWTEATLSKLEE